MGDAGEIIFGRPGRIVLEIGQLLLLIFVMSSHILTGTIVLSTITDNGACAIVFGVVSLIICFLGAIPRTMAKVYWFSLICEYSPFMKLLMLLLIIQT
jgi:hypothetical protein